MQLVVHVKPNARETRVVSQLDDHTFVISLRVPATEGRANDELVEFLADKLGIPKTFINLKRGHTNKIKQLVIPDGTGLRSLGNPTEAT